MNGETRSTSKKRPQSRVRKNTEEMSAQRQKLATQEEIDEATESFNKWIEGTNESAMSNSKKRIREIPQHSGEKKKKEESSISQLAAVANRWSTKIGRARSKIPTTDLSLPTINKLKEMMHEIENIRKTFIKQNQSNGVASAFVDLKQANGNMKKFSDRAKDVLKKAKVFFGK